MAKLREIKVKDAPIKMIWADPASLDENPKNWRVHPKSQTEAVGGLIERFDWVGALLYNKTTGQLIDGHDRRKIAIEKGIKHVPVLVGNWTEQQEDEILATLDPSAAMAKSDPEKLEELMRGLTDSGPIIQQMMAGLAESEGVLKMLAERQASATGEDDDDDDDDSPEQAYEPPARDRNDIYRGDEGPVYPAVPPSLATGDVPFERPEPRPAEPATHHRQVNLFLTSERFERFNEMIGDLAEEFGTEGTTDTIYAALERCCELPEEGEEQEGQDTA